MIVVAALVIALLAPVATLAEVTAEDASRLDRDLTPVGAERAGNADGTIPAWTGGLPETAMDPAVGYVDLYAPDQVLFTITADNPDRYRDRLTPGQLALAALALSVEVRACVSQRAIDGRGADLRELVLDGDAPRLRQTGR